MSIRLNDSNESLPTFRGDDIDNENDGTVDLEIQSVVSASDKYKKSFLYKVLKYLSRYKIIYVPVLNWCVLFTFISLLYKLIYKYESLYARSVLLTTIISNTLLYGLSDTLAQCISCFLEMLSQRQLRLRSSSTGSIFLDNLNNFSSYRDQPNDSFYTDYGDTRVTNRHRQNSQVDNPNYQQLSEQTDKDIFNFYRFLGFMFWGFVIAFFQSGWYWILNHFYTSEPTFVSVLERVLSDQLVYSPISLFAFFSYSNFVLESGDKFTLSEKIRKIYFSTLIANYMVWPLVQFINFLFMPRRFQVPFSSSSE